MHPVGNNSSPQYVITRDIDRDTQLDIISVNSNDDSISVIRGLGNGTFAEQLKYHMGVGSHPHAVASGDFNNDNRSDVVVAISGDNRIRILFGYGNGSFLPILTYSIGRLSYPSVVVTKDLNHDNQLDIVLITEEDSSVGILLGYDNGSFSMIKTYPTGEYVLLQSIGIGDVDNGGHLDIVVADSGSNIRILIGNENGTFDDTMTFSIISHCGLNFVTVADLDNDNQADIIAVSSSRNNIIILFGFGNGTFADIRIYSTGDGSQPNSASISDFNSDSILDLAVANSGTSNILVLFGNGDGRFRNDTAQVYYFGYGYHPYSIVATDMNGDGWMDIVVACQGTDHVEILMQIC